MKSSHAKKASITLPDALESELQKRAKKEHRTLSGMLQETARFYLTTKRFEELQEELALKAASLGIRTEEEVDRLIHESRM
jgi:predicted transcriptional regulator